MICPVGLPIGAHSVPEIAVSIVAQVVAQDRLGPEAAVLAEAAAGWRAVYAEVAVEQGATEGAE